MPGPYGRPGEPVVVPDPAITSFSLDCDAEAGRWTLLAAADSWTGGAETAWEKQKREQKEARAEIEADPFVRSVLEAFPGAEILGVKQLALPQGEAASDPPVEPEDED